MDAFAAHTHLVPDSELDIGSVNLSLVVGHAIQVFSEQFPGRSLSSRAMSVSNQTIAIDRAGNGGLIDSLVSNQQVVLQIPYKGELLSVCGTLKRRSGGQCFVLMSDQVVPLRQRRFHRAPLCVPLRAAILPTLGLNRKRLSTLRWVKADTVNISSGGVLLRISSLLQSSTHLIMNIGIEQFEFPILVTAQIRHCFPDLSGQPLVGAEFVVREEQAKHFEQTDLQSMPAPALEYTDSRRNQLNREIIAWTQKEEARRL
ncbi:MAG: PilZ domain-containing protein [Candidatus Zixiibacteriota bacterium]